MVPAGLELVAGDVLPHLWNFLGFVFSQQAPNNRFFSSLPVQGAAPKRSSHLPAVCYNYTC